MVSPNTPVWQDDRAVALPTLDGDHEADVCVVGLGGSGLACIHELIALGKRVVGVDAGRVAGGAAGRNGGFLLGGLAMFHHDARQRLGRAVAKAVYEQTLMEIDRMAGETPSAIRCTGSLRIATSDAEREDCAQQLEAMREDGLPAEEYRGPEGTGILFPADAAFNPAKRCAALAGDAVARGARLFEQSPVTCVEPGLARAERGSVRARSIIVAVDGRLEQIFPELAPRVRSARLQMLATEPTDEIELPRPVYARWGLDYWQRSADRRVVLGGCRDVGGDAEWTTDSRPTEVVQAALTSLLRDGLGVNAGVTHRWAATVGYTQSGLPIVEQVRPDVWAIGAYSGTGNVVGAMCGRAAARLVTDGHAPIADLLRA